MRNIVMFQRMQIDAQHACRDEKTYPTSSNVQSTPLLKPVERVGLNKTLELHEHARMHLVARGFIQFHPLLAEKLDSFKAAIFLGHALYWSRHLRKTQAHRSGWFWMTAREWQQATGLSQREQTAVRQMLVEKKLLAETLAGNPAKLHYRVNLDAVGSLLSLERPTWDVLAQLFQPCLAFYKPLADIAGNVASGLYLSYLLQQQRRSLLGRGFNNNGYFSIDLDDVRQSVCLGSKTQRNARDKLKAAGFVQEHWIPGAKPQLLVSLNLDAIMSCLQAQGGKPLSQRASKSRTPVPAPGSALRLIAPTSVASTTSPPLGQSVMQETAAAFAQLKQPTKPVAAPAHVQLGLFRPSLIAAVGKGKNRAQAAPAKANTSAMQSILGMLAGSNPNGYLQSKKQAPQYQGTQPVAVLSKLTAKPDAVLLKLDGPFVETELPFCRNIQQVLTINTTTTTTPVPKTVSNVPTASAGRRSRRVHDTPQKIQLLDKQGALTGTPASAPEPRPAPEPANALVVPFALGSEWHGAVLSTVQKAPAEIRQALLDELAGQLALPNKTINNPVGWLYTLIDCHVRGELVLAMADKVAVDRADREALALRVQKMQEEPVHPAPRVKEPVVLSDAAQTHLERLRRLRASMAGSEVKP